MTCPGSDSAWPVALTISDVNALLLPRLISTSVEALRLAILPIEYGTRVSISDESDPRAYVRLAALLRRQIAEGTLAPGMPTPSITTLSQQYGHARQTCAKALRTLEDEGLLRPARLGLELALERLLDHDPHQRVCLAVRLPPGPDSAPGPLP